METNGNSANRTAGAANAGDKRASHRRRVFKGAMIRFNNGFSSFGCVIRNLSGTGALLELEDGNVPPEHFELICELDGFKVGCKVVRRDGNSVGVLFTSEMEHIAKTRKQVVEDSGFSYTEEKASAGMKAAGVPRADNSRQSAAQTHRRKPSGPVFGKRR